MRAGSTSTAVLIGYREKNRGDKLYEMPPREAAERRRDIGMVFQHFNLFPQHERTTAFLSKVL